MIIYDETIATLTPKAKKIISDGLFPGIYVENVWNPNGGASLNWKTNVFLSEGEEYLSPIDWHTTLVGQSRSFYNPLNGTMIVPHIVLKDEI